MGLNSKSEKRGVDVSLLDDGENDERPSKRLKPLDNKGGLHAIIAEEYKTSSGPPSPVPFLSPDGRVTKPAEIFRTDLISAMKLPDTQILNAENYMTIVDPWRQEWERGVQVPVHPEWLAQPSFTVVDAPKKATNFKLTGKLLNSEEKRKGKSPCNYDLDRTDVEWLTNLNKSRQIKGRIELDEGVLEKSISYLEDKCYENLGYAIVTQEGLSIEYDESVCCDVCQSPDSEESNEMVFCDSCDICVHQACYGIQDIPSGSWLCRPCSRAVTKPPCQLCSNPGGAMKRTRKGKNWVHVSCALWVPEVGFGCVERMEPIIKIESIPASRWNLVCYLCREKEGACIQCTVKTCMKAFHVTCGFKNGLEMKTILDDSAVDGVRHLCYCAKHGYKNKSPPRTPDKIKQDAEDAENQRQKKLKQMETEFYKYVDVAELAKDLNIPKELANHIHAFWTLKRKARDDIPLLPPTIEQQEKLCGKQGAASRTLQIQIEELMKMRCDLERLRNLCYMVSKREKLRRELYRIREQVFWKAHEVMVDDTINVDDNDVKWIGEACGKNFASDGSEPSIKPLSENPPEPVSSPSAPTCATEKTGTDELRGEQSQEPSDCSEDDVRGGYESSDSEDSPRIKTRRRLRGVGLRRSLKEVVSRIPSDNNDNQHGTSVNKSSGAKDDIHEETTESTYEETKPEDNLTPRRSLRFHKLSVSSDETDRHDSPFKDEHTTVQTSPQRRVSRHNGKEDLDNTIGLHRPCTRGQTTSESTSDEMELESVRPEGTAASPSRTLRSGTVISPPKKIKIRSKSIGDIDSTPLRETRKTRSSLSQSDGEVIVAKIATELSTTTTDTLATPRLPDEYVNKEEQVLKEKNIRSRAGRTRTSTQSESTDDSGDILPGKRPRVEVRRRSKSRRGNKEELDNAQARITQFFLKKSPKQKRTTKSPKAKFLNGYRSPKSAKSTESESSKSDEENTEHRVKRLSSLRSFNPCKDTIPQSPCPKCQIQHNRKRSMSKSPERKNKELRARNMQSPRSRSRLVSSLRCSPSRSCSNTLTQVASVV